MHAAVIINLVDAYEIQLRLRPISICTHQAYQGEILPNLALSLPKFIPVPAIKSGYRWLL